MGSDGPGVLLRVGLPVPSAPVSVTPTALAAWMSNMLTGLSGCLVSSLGVIPRSAVPLTARRAGIWTPGTGRIAGFRPGRSG